MYNLPFAPPAQFASGKLNSAVRAPASRRISGNSTSDKNLTLQTRAPDGQADCSGLAYIDAGEYNSVPVIGEAN